MTFLPGASDVSGAWRIPVGAAQDVETGVVTLVRTRFVQLSGKVVNERGLAMSDQGVRLLPGPSVTVGLDADTSTAHDGTFEFRGLSPGVYVLQTVPTVSQPLRFGSQVVSVLEDATVVLEARPGRTVRATDNTDKPDSQRMPRIPRTVRVSSR